MNGTITINGVELTKSNFPHDDGTGRNHIRKTGDFGGTFGFVKVTFKGAVFYSEHAEEPGELLGKLGQEFTSEAELLAFIKEEFEAVA